MSLVSLSLSLSLVLSLFFRQLSKVQFDFQALSETTVVMLHLEVRTHCFYYLQPALHKVRTTLLQTSFPYDAWERG